MSYPSSSSMSNGAASDQSGRYIVPPQAIQSAISTHQQSAQIKQVTPGDQLSELKMQWHAAYAAFASGAMSSAEYDVVQKRLLDAGRAFDRRTADYDARRQSGQAKPTDLYKEFYGCTDEEAEERLRYKLNLADTQRANEARSRSRMLQHSSQGRGH